MSNLIPGEIIPEQGEIELKPYAFLKPENGTNLTSVVSPGSNLIAVPAGMSRRIPFVISRSKIKALFASKK